MMNARQNNPSADKLEYGLFAVSKYSYPARNAAFLSMLSRIVRPGKGNLALLGSGPLEPLEVCGMPDYRKWDVDAFDNNIDIIGILKNFKRSQNRILNLEHLAQICRSDCSINNALIDSRRIIHHTHLAGNLGIIESYDEERRALSINTPNINRLRIHSTDLCQDFPALLYRADIIFEGFMLINWEKSPQNFYLPLFLRRIAAALKPTSWFASVSSASHYAKSGSKGNESYFSKLMSAGLFPYAGITTRSSIADDNKLISHFGIVLSRQDRSDPAPVLLNDEIASITSRVCEYSGLDIRAKRCGLEDLASLLTEGDVLSFSWQGDGYSVYHQRGLKEELAKGDFSLAQISNYRCPFSPE